MNNNAWLERIEQKKQQATTTKFKGKFQEAAKVNRNRGYPSYTKEEIAAGGKWTPPNANGDSFPAVPPIAMPMIDIGPVSAVKVNPPEFVDLSATPNSGNDRYKSYERLKLMEDAMIVYSTGRSQPMADSMSAGAMMVDGELMYKEEKVSMACTCSSPMDACSSCPPERFENGDCDDVCMDDCDCGLDYCGDCGMDKYYQATLDAAVLPSQMTRKLCSEDVRAARKYEAESGESACEWKELRMKQLEDLKMQVKAQNPQCLGVPLTTISSGTVTINPAQVQHYTIGTDRKVFYVDVPAEKATQFMENLKELFEKKKIEGKAAESETWFAGQGNGRGTVPSVSDVFGRNAGLGYSTVSGDVFGQSPVSVGGGSFTISSPYQDAMANDMAYTCVGCASPEGPIGSVGEPGIEGEPGISDEPTVFVNCCTRSSIEVLPSSPLYDAAIHGKSVEERWNPPTQDEDICMPMRAKGEVDDAVYFRNKLFTAMNFPSKYKSKEEPATGLEF